MTSPVYQVLSRPRTGSSVLYRHAWHNSKNYTGRLGEYFNIDDTEEEYEEKFKYLETEKEQNKHYCIKIHTGQIRDIQRTIDFLKDYHTYVTERDPWDAFLSYMFCELTNWEGPHRFSDIDGKKVFGKWTKQGKQVANIDITNFILLITENNVSQHIEIYKRDIELIKTITSNVPHTVFNYENLPKYEHIIPLGIDYEKHVPNVEKYKTMFRELLND